MIRVKIALLFALLILQMAAVDVALYLVVMFASPWQTFAIMLGVLAGAEIFIVEKWVTK